jgi:hypothetical protein
MNSKLDLNQLDDDYFDSLSPEEIDRLYDEQITTANTSKYDLMTPEEIDAEYESLKKGNAKSDQPSIYDRARQGIKAGWGHTAMALEDFGAWLGEHNSDEGVAALDPEEHEYQKRIKKNRKERHEKLEEEEYKPLVKGDPLHYGAEFVADIPITALKTVKAVAKASKAAKPVVIKAIKELGGGFSLGAGSQGLKNNGHNETLVDIGTAIVPFAKSGAKSLKDHLQRKAVGLDKNNIDLDMVKNRIPVRASTVSKSDKTRIIEEGAADTPFARKNHYKRVKEEVDALDKDFKSKILEKIGLDDSEESKKILTDLKSNELSLREPIKYTPVDINDLKKDISTLSEPRNINVSQEQKTVLDTLKENLAQDSRARRNYTLEDLIAKKEILNKEYKRLYRKVGVSDADLKPLTDAIELCNEKILSLGEDISGSWSKAFKDSSETYKGHKQRQSVTRKLDTKDFDAKKIAAYVQKNPESKESVEKILKKAGVAAEDWADIEKYANKIAKPTPKNFDFLSDIGETGGRRAKQAAHILRVTNPKYHRVVDSDFIKRAVENARNPGSEAINNLQKALQRSVKRSIFNQERD